MSGSSILRAFEQGFAAGQRHVSRQALLQQCRAQRPSWQQTMLRVKDPKVSVAFYQEHFGFTHIDTFHFPKWKFSIYFLATIR